MFDTSSPNNAKAILREVAEKHGLALTDFESTGLRAPMKMTAARAEAAYRLRFERGLSFPRIAATVGYRDHTSAMHGVWIHREALGDPEAIVYLRAKRARHLAAIRKRNAISAPLSKRLRRSSLLKKMRGRLGSDKVSDVVMALRYFVEWDGKTLLWSLASGHGGKNFKYKIQIGIPGQVFTRAHVLWLLLTGSRAGWWIKHRPNLGPFGPKTIFCNGESLAEYLRRVPEYGSQYRSPGRSKKAYWRSLPVLPPANAIERKSPPDARSSGPAQIPPPA